MLDFATDCNATAPAATKHSEQQARDYLAQITSERPTVRDLAATWGWSKSTTARFLSQIDAEKLGTNVGQRSCPTEPTPYERRQMLVNATIDYDAKFPP